MNKDDFLGKLQLQAEKQAKLHHSRFLPAQLDFITSFIGHHPWQVMMVVSFVTALGVEVVSRWGVL